MSILSFLLPLSTGEFFINSSDLILMLIIPFLVAGFAITIVYLNFKEYTFYYNSLTKIEIIRQMREDYHLIRQTPKNHFIFKKQNLNLFSLKFVLVFDNDSITYYGTRKTGKNIRDFFQLKEYKTTHFTDGIISLPEN